MTQPVPDKGSAAGRESDVFLLKNPKPCLEGHGDVVSGVIIWLMGVITLTYLAPNLIARFRGYRVLSPILQPNFWDPRSRNEPAGIL